MQLVPSVDFYSSGGAGTRWMYKLTSAAMKIAVPMAPMNKPITCIADMLPYPGRALHHHKQSAHKRDDANQNDRKIQVLWIARSDANTPWSALDPSDSQAS